MNKSRNIEQKNEIFRQKNNSRNKLNYLTDSSCSEIQKILRQDYFSRLQKASLNNLINYVTEDDPKFKTIDKHNNLEEINNNNPINYAARQILFSDKVRKNNFNKIKKHPRRILNSYDSKNMHVMKSTDSFQDLMKEEENDDVKKMFIFKPKKIYRDLYPINYDSNYIDEVEKKFIKPYLSKNTIVYHEYIANKKSKTPFNFIIG